MGTLQGKRIVVTRAEEQADDMISRLKSLGAEVVHLPMIEFVPPDSWHDCDQAIEKLPNYNWIIFTSVNGIRFFLRRVEEKKTPLAALTEKSIAAVGERTATELTSLGLTVDLIPERYDAEGLVEAFKKLDLKDVRMLLVQPQKSRDFLARHLRDMQAQVDIAVVYKNQPTDAKTLNQSAAIMNGSMIDVVTFTSPSTVRNFAKLFGSEKLTKWIDRGCKTAAIGNITAAALTELHLPVDILPEKATASDLIDKIADYFHE